MRPEEESKGPVIRDLRRIDPVTGQVRDTGESGSKRGPAPAGGQPKPGKHSVSSPGGASAGQGGDTSAEPGKPSGATATAAAGGEPPAGGTGNGGSPADGVSAGPGPAAAQVATMLAERTADLQRLQAEYSNYRKRVERDRLAVREQALANVLHGLLPVLDDIGRAREHGELTGGFKSVADSLESTVVKLGLTTFGESGDPFDPTMHEALMHSYSPDVTEPTAVQILQPGYKVGERIIRPARVAVAEPGGDAAEAEAEAEAAVKAEAEPADEAGPAEPAEEAGAAEPADGGETAE